MFNCIWWRAQTAEDINEDGIVSVEEFRRAYNEYEDAVKEGGLPAWWESASVAVAEVRDLGKREE